jgi:hypothetical protein
MKKMNILNIRIQWLLVSLGIITITFHVILRSMDLKIPSLLYNCWGIFNLVYLCWALKISSKVNCSFHKYYGIACIINSLVFLGILVLSYIGYFPILSKKTILTLIYYFIFLGLIGTLSFDMWRQICRYRIN